MRVPAWGRVAYGRYQSGGRSVAYEWQSSPAIIPPHVTGNFIRESGTWRRRAILFIVRNHAYGARRERYVALARAET